MAVVTQRVNIEAVIAARHHDVVSEGDVGIGKAQQGRAGIRCPRRLLSRRPSEALSSAPAIASVIMSSEASSAFLAMLMSGGLLLLGDCFICCCLDRRWQKTFGG